MSNAAAAFIFPMYYCGYGNCNRPKRTNVISKSAKTRWTNVENKNYKDKFSFRQRNYKKLIKIIKQCMQNQIILQVLGTKLNQDKIYFIQSILLLDTDKIIHLKQP